jgi:hypothetical protein
MDRDHQSGPVSDAPESGRSKASRLEELIGRRVGRVIQDGQRPVTIDLNLHRVAELPIDRHGDDAFRTVDPFEQTDKFGEDSDWFHRAWAHPPEIRAPDLVTLPVRRHGGNMTEEKNCSTLHRLQVPKTHLNRKRIQS